MDEDREYVQFVVVHMDKYGQIEPVHPGNLPRYTDALAIKRMNGHVDIWEVDVWNAYEHGVAQLIHECGTERELRQTEDQRTYWHCPTCDPDNDDEVVGP